MSAPRFGWLLALLASLALLCGAALLGERPLETLSLDLRHSAIAASTGAPSVAFPDAEPAIGMNVFLEQEVEPERRQQSIDLLRAAGVTWVRQELPWEQIEPVARGQTEDPKFGGSTWSKFDDIVERADAAGMQVMLRLDTSPRWALPPDARDGLGPPVALSDYLDFVSAVATRYRGRVAAYQVWNEPNLTSEWGGRPPDSGAYAAMLLGASERIRAADPSARVVMAALAPTLTQNADAMDEVVYLQALYGAGVRGSFDVLAVQAYGLRSGPDDPRVDPAADVNFSRPTLVRAVMEANGDAGVPVWATEMGWNANPPEFAVQQFGRVTPALQARYTVRAYTRMAQQWPWLKVGFVWYWKRPDLTNVGQDWFWFRVADPDFVLQPVYYALKDYATTR